MKKVLFLAAVTMFFAACHNNSPEQEPCPIPMAWDGTLHIVKFKKTEYRDYVLSHQYREQQTDSSMESVYYGVNVVALISDTNTIIDANLTQYMYKKVWRTLTDGYFLCAGVITAIFADTSDRFYYYRIHDTINYESSFGNLYLLDYTWAEMAEDVIKERRAEIYRGGVLIKADDSVVRDVHPLLEHYVVTAKSLYDFTQTPYDSDFTEDALCKKMGEMLKDIIELGNLQEYLDFDLTYHNKHELSAWWDYYYRSYSK